MLAISVPTSFQTRYRLNYCMIITHTVIALISARMVGLIDARTNHKNFTQYSHLNTSTLSKANAVLGRGHSHNDYHQKDPLRSALLHGLRSVEVDVFPIEGQLFVAHTRLELDERKTIDDMYINPILDVLKFQKKEINHQSRQHPFPLVSSQRNYSKIISSPYLLQYKQQKSLHLHQKKEGNLIDTSDDSLILLVDFKADPNVSAKLLKRAIKPLKPYLSQVKNGKFHKGKVTVLISGNRPKEENLFDDIDNTIDDDNIISTASSTNKIPSFGMKKLVNVSSRPFGVTSSMLRQRKPIDSNEVNKALQQRNKNARFLFIDGRINDLYQQKPTSVYPLISLNWSTVTFYHLFGKGDDFMKKCALIAHSQGKRIRVWGAPNIESVWRRIIRNNIDWLSIDDHDRFATFAMNSI